MSRGKSRNLLRPGELAPRSGIYESTHRRHRAPHPVTVLRGEVFPSCRVCGDHVRYRLTSEAAQSAAQPAPSLLLVDPENSVSYTLKQILQNSGYQVTTASSYRSAADSLRHSRFDVVLTELDLERGAEGLRLALDAKRQQPAPAIILSASKPTEQGLRAALGLANYLVLKPIDLSELQNALDTMVSRRALQLAVD